MGGGCLRRALICCAAAVLLGGGTAHAKLLTVSSTADVGAGSLRDTIAAAATGDVVYLPASATHYLVTSGAIAIANKKLTILGAGSAQSIVDGTDSTRVLSTSGTTALSISRL